MLSIPEAKLRNVVTQILKHAGSEQEEAETVTDHLVRANLTGHDSHGVGLLPQYLSHIENGQLFPNRKVELVKNDGSIMMFDGHKGYGQAQAKDAMEQALARCKETGLVLMTLRNSHHIGRIGTYGEQSIKAKKVSLHFVNVTNHGPTVAPYGGTKARFVTNPVCIAMPGTSNTEPILLDMATSKIALGKARVAMNKGVEVPDNSVIDAEGIATNDPNVLFQEPRGAMLPMGDYKGSGLALFCELLGGALSGGGTVQPKNPREGGIVNNMFALIVDPKRLVDESYLASEIDEMVSYLKGTPAQSETGPVKIAGEPERENMQERQANGLPIAEAAWKGIADAAVKIGLSEELFHL